MNRSILKSLVFAIMVILDLLLLFSVMSMAHGMVAVILPVLVIVVFNFFDGVLRANHRVGELWKIFDGAVGASMLVCIFLLGDLSVLNPANWLLIFPYLGLVVVSFAAGNIIGME